MEQEVKHHRISMSQWSALAVCPHFVPSRKPSPLADEGTAAHREAAEIFSKIPGREPRDAYLFEGKYHQAAWCAEQYRTRQMMADTGLSAEELEQYESASAVEMKLTIMQTDPLIDGIYGYADFVRLMRRKSDGVLVQILVADFKTFSDGTRNYDEQLAGYAVAVASTIPNADDDVEVLLETLHGAALRSTRTTTTLGECRRIAVDTVMKYLCRDRFPKVLNPKCRYCQHYPCEGAIQMLKAVQPAFAGLQLSASSMESDPQSVPLTLAALEEVQKLIDAVGENAKECIKKHGVKGVTKDGLPKWELGTDDCRYEVRTALGSRKIPDVPKAVSALTGANIGDGISLAELMPLCSMPVGKLETLVRKKILGTPKAAAEVIERLGIVERGANTETMKRIA